MQPRIAKSRRTPEEDLHRMVVYWLAVAVPPPSQGGPFWTHPHNEGFRSKAEAGRAKAMGQRAGTPDLVFCHAGRFLGVELKSAKGTASDAQKDTHRDITFAGGVVAVCRTLDEVKSFLADHGVPMREARVFGGGAGWRHPKAAPDVPAGQCWANRSHRTMAQVIADENKGKEGGS